MNCEFTSSSGYLLPLNSSPRQVMTLNVTLDGEPMQAQVEIRYLPAPDQWFFSLRDHATGELLVNMIPLICSRGEVNDLLLPFRHLREGKGVGSLICLRAGEETESPDPAAGNLQEFSILWSDRMLN
ncbi:phage baseplate plug family protein [Aristaeella hokkaidonensis]|uniref:Uncharacterized protein n=1 Tax=Aristaeella hokkaidonensis TaxID=3046382 RepID=A0AC61MUV7_9FIRM|nr:hypothetical protein [Aristaeella hokkaidonensis]QUC66190.1 hypothetical protein JYE49_09950 [Aristaeella hokkaidonensis]SNT94802.1 hypothetical protein SAMN06297421_10730 [Aristaeella hokkaidonensis]